MCIRWLWFYDVFIITKIFFLTLLVAAFLLHIALSLKHSDVGWKKQTAGNLLTLAFSIFLGAEQQRHRSLTLGHELLQGRVGFSPCGVKAHSHLCSVDGWCHIRATWGWTQQSPTHAAGCEHLLRMRYEGPELSAILPPVMGKGGRNNTQSPSGLACPSHTPVQSSLRAGSPPCPLLPAQCPKGRRRAGTTPDWLSSLAGSHSSTTTRIQHRPYAGKW